MSRYPTVPLGDLLKVHYGKALKAEERDDTGNFDVYGSSGKIGKHHSALLNHPTIIIGRKGSVGAVTYAPNGGWAIDTAFYTETLDSNALDLRFLFYALNLAKLAQHTITTSIPGLNRDDIYSTKIPLPPLPEQKRIASILDKVDSIRRKRQEAVWLSEELTSSAFLQMFGDPATNPKGWTVDALEKHINFITTGSRGWAEYYSSEGSRFIRSLDVQMNYISNNEVAYVNAPKGAEADRTRVQIGDVLLTVTGSKIGRVAPVPKKIGDAYVSQHVAIIRTAKTLHPSYLSMFLSLPCGGQRQIQQSQYGQTKPGLNLEQIREFKVPCPPIALQNQFADFCKRAIGSNLRFENAERATDGLFYSLLQRAFKGDL